MGSTKNHDKGPVHGAAAQGYSAAYEADKARAERALTEVMAGAPAPVASDETGIKNPDGEFSNPAPMIHPGLGDSGPGPNGPGNSKGDGSIDPQGQQGGTHGGQAASPGLPNAGSPLASAEDRREQSTQRSAGGHDEGPA